MNPQGKHIEVTLTIDEALDLAAILAIAEWSSSNTDFRKTARIILKKLTPSMRKIWKEVAQ